ncbi:MAG TPA: hypothetical protein VJN32_05020 [Dehalococcoidia bacterium]|nr:hypothetical protein [Dehalococcoidia bacterium]
MWKIVGSVSLAVALVSLACGDEKPEQASPTATFPKEIIDAVQAYVGTTGLGGDTFDLTQPIDCDSITAQVDAAASEPEADEILQGTVGKLCVVSNAADIGPSNAIVAVGLYATEATWKILLTREESGWEVVDVQAFVE